MKGYRNRLEEDRCFRLEALNFEYDPYYDSFPVRATDANMILPGVIPDKEYKYHLRRIGCYIAGGVVLMIVVWFMVTVAVGLHMGRLILRGDVEVPKVYELICDHGR